MRTAHLANWIALVRFGLVWFPLLLVIPVSAQDVTNPLNVGFPTNGVFSGSDFDSVQLNNGNLHIEIPLWSDKGRGLGVSFKYIYDNKGWGFHQTCDKQGICTDSVREETGNSVTLKLVGPFGYGAGGKEVLQQCISGITVLTWTNYVLREPNGTKHHFVPDTTTPGGSNCWPATGTTLHADDGSGWVLHPDSTGIVQSIVRKDGTVINPRYNPNNQWTSAGTSIEDTNGNQLILPGSNNGAVVTSGMDTLGRTVNLDGSYYDSSGTLRSFQITNQNVAFQTSLCGASFADRCSELSGTVAIPQVLTLPNGMTYTFTYDQGSPTHPYYLQPLSVTLPTGGTISWGWGAPQDESGPVVSSRQLLGDPNPYSYTVCPGKKVPGATATGKATDPAGNDTVITCSYFLPPYPPRLADFGIAYITNQQYYQGSSTSGHLIKTVQTDYVTSGAVLPVHETTTWNQQNLVSRVETDYDLYPAWSDFSGTSHSISAQNPTERREYAFGSGTTWGSQVRTTDYAYLHVTNSTYRNANMVDLTTSKIVHSGSSSGAIVAQTKYTYDGVTTTSTSGTPAPDHDYTGFGTSNNIRGNLTQTGQGLLVGSTWTWLNTNNTYDDLGNKLSITDPKTNKTQFSFADSWADANCTVGSNTFAYLTTLTDPLQHQTKHSYFRCMGLLASTKDQNDISNSRSGATFTYDLLNRPLLTTFPDGGQTTNSYVDTVPLTVTQQKLVTTGLNIQHAMQFDGLGRPQQSQFNDPDCGGGTGLVKVDHAYGFTSGAGRFTQVSTPYCNSPDATHGLMTTTNYDALDRVTSVAQTDGSTISTTYGGTAAGLTSTVSDEAGNRRTSQSDALGRMTAVWEDPSSLNYETDYAYDALDNLTKVTQTGGAASSSWRTRTFAYDSLSRLKCAGNPEVTSSVNTPASCPASDTGTYTPGTIGYTYDADGNVQTKTAPAPNQTATGSTVATTYSYDALNRLTQKSYAGGPTTATVKYGYDGVALSGCTTAPPALSPVDANPVSYRTAMCDGSGASAWAHDPLGRVLTEQRIINGTSAINKNTKYAYYKDGELNKLTYPGSGRVITYTANSSGGFSAGRSVSAIAADGTSYVSAATYAPQGAPSALTFGGTINGAFSYNKRLQPVQVFYGTNAPGGLTGVSCPATIGNIMHRAYDFHIGAGDNGNVFIVRNCLNTSRTQNFSYDALNRIATAATQGATCAACWGQMFGHMSGTTFVPGIDAWGNLHEITATQGSPTMLTQSVSNNNQFVGMTYDAAGNLTNDGQGSAYTYDAENRLTATTATAGYSYVYDGDGKRVKKCSNSGCTTGKLYWTGMGSDPLAESGLGGSNTEEYVFFAGKRVARRDVSNLAVHYYFSDHLGSASVITDNLGTMPPQKEADYYPYGGEVVVSGSDINNYKFTGKERDSESGLDNFGKRYYASAMGRFSSTDPGPHVWADPQTLNRYTYTRNNPLRYVDPTGMYFVVAAEMQAQVKQYISTMLRSPQGAAMIRAISANPKPNFFSQGTLDRHQVPATDRVAVTNGTTTPIAGNQPGQVAGTQTILSNSNIAFTAGFSTGAMAGDIFAVGLKAFAHEDAHVVDINAAHTLSQAAVAGAAGDAPTQPGAENTAGGTAEGRALGVMGELGDAGQSFQPNAQTDAQADAIIQSGMQQLGEDQQQQINQAVEHHGCTSDSEGQQCD